MRSDFSLTRDDVVRFHAQGYLGPFTAVSPDEMTRIATHVRDHVFTTEGPQPIDRTHSRHLDSPEVYALASHPAVVQRVASILGEDVQLWTNGFFIKQPKVGKATEWHQDINYWPLEPAVNITCWMAFDDVTADNSPMRLIPGSHRKLLPHRKSAGATLGEEADPAHFDESKAITMTMRAGQFIIFSERMLHSAPPNFSDKPRTAMVTRYTLGITKVYQDERPINFPRHRTLFVSGQDRIGINNVGEPPRLR